MMQQKIATKIQIKTSDDKYERMKINKQLTKRIKWYTINTIEKNKTYKWLMDIKENRKSGIE